MQVWLPCLTVKEQACLAIKLKKCTLFAGWEVRIAKTCDRGIEIFQDLRHSLKSIFQFFHFHLHKHATLFKCSELTDVVKRDFFILIL